MTAQSFQVGAVFPQTEIGTDPLVIRDFAQAVEDMGFWQLLAYDHVVGADITNRPGWNMPYTSETVFHEPLTLFSYLAGLTRRLVLMTGVIILPQRQTVLFGKQAANVDVFSGGRLRLGIGLGWNEIEYEALGVDFGTRAKRFDDQIRFLRRLWTEPSFTDHGPFHDISEAGIKPLPVQRPIPLIIGGAAAAMQRAARVGDGWVPVIKNAEQAQDTVGAFRDAVIAAGRDPEAVRLENNIILGGTLGGSTRTAEDAVADAALWRKAGARGVNFHTMGMGFASPDDHLRFLERIAEMLSLGPAP